MSNAWLRALVLCEDIRFEVGGGVTLVGVYADQIFTSRLDESDPSIVLPRFGIYAVVAGLTGTSELVWQKRLLHAGAPLEGPPTLEGTDEHDPTADEHRLISLLSPLAFPRPGRYTLSLTFETKRDRRSIDHHFTLAFGTPPELLTH